MAITLSSWTTQVQAGFPGTAFYRGSSGIATPRTGTYAYSISNLAYGTLESPNITVSASTSYTVYAYLRGELDAHDSNGSWTMRVKYYTSSGTYISQADVSTGTSLTTTWTLKGGTITTPSTAARMRVQFINQMNAGWLAVDDLSVSTVGGFSMEVYSWGFETEGGSEGSWSTSAQAGFGNTTSFYRGGSGIAAPRTGNSAYAISNLANGMLVSEAMVTIPSTTYTVNAYLHSETDSVGSEGNWQINACFYKFDGAPSSCSILASGSAPAANWTQVSGTVTSPADAATMKLELVGAQLSGWLAWDDVSVSLDTQMITKYYYAGSQRVAVRKNGVLNYLLNDHLGSASVVTDAGGSLLSKMLYKPWGETRYTSGVMPTDRLYTGQIAEPNLGLYFYNARWVDPALGRFTQADTLIPEPGNPQSWDRYSYVNNSPLMYTDPSGHQAWDGCSGENGGCAGGSNYSDYVYNYLHTDQERQENQEDLEKAVDTVTTVIGIVNEPADWMMTAAYCAAGECSPWVLMGLLPFIPGSVGDDIGEGLIRLVRTDQIGTSQPFKLRKGEDGLSVFEGVTPEEVLKYFPGNEVPNSTVIIPKDKLPLGTEVISKLDPGLPQRLSEAHRILARPEGWSIDRFAKALKEIIGWK